MIGHWCKKKDDMTSDSVNGDHQLLRVILKNTSATERKVGLLVDLPSSLFQILMSCCLLFSFYPSNHGHSQCQCNANILSANMPVNPVLPPCNTGNAQHANAAGNQDAQPPAPNICLHWMPPSLPKSRSSWPLSTWGSLPMQQPTLWANRGWNHSKNSISWWTKKPRPCAVSSMPRWTSSIWITCWGMVLGPCSTPYGGQVVELHVSLRMAGGGLFPHTGCSLTSRHM